MENKAESKGPINHISLDTQTLYKRLRESTVGEIITYKQLSELIGKDVQSKGRSSLSSARRKVRSEHDIVYRTLIEVGIQRCNDDEKVSEIERQKNRVRSAAKEGRRIQQAVKYENLSVEAQQQYNIECSVLRATELFTKPQTGKKLKQAVLNNNQMLEVGDIAGLFGKKSS